jgi:hypothetical protein
MNTLMACHHNKLIIVSETVPTGLGSMKRKGNGDEYDNGLPPQ